MRKLTLISLLAVLTLLVAACGGGNTGANGADSNTGTDSGTTGTSGDTGTDAGTESGSAPVELAVDGTNDLKFVPDALSAQVGQTVNFTLNNPSALEHNWVWTEGDEEFIPVVAPGAAGSNSRTFDSAGSYEFYCSIPGHREAGMVGTVTVE